MRRSASHRLVSLGGVEGRAQELTRRAGRLRQKGELRRAAVALREACALGDRGEDGAARWMMLGHLEALLGKRGDAERAMKQSLFLRERHGEKRKANVVRKLILRLASAAH